MVNKVVKRSLKKDKGIFIAINAMIFITILLSSIALLSYNIGFKNTQTYKEEVNLEDFQMQTIQPLSNKEINDLEQDYNLQIQQDNKYVFEQGNKQITIYQYEEDRTVSNIKVLDGQSKVKDDQIILSSGYAKANDIQLNDNITINDKQLEVVGQSFFAEDTYPVKKGSFFPENENVAVGFVNENTFNELSSQQNIIKIYRGRFNDKVEDKSKVYENIKEDLTTKTVQTNIIGQPTEPVQFVQQSNVVSLVDYMNNFNIGMIELEYKFISVIMFGMSFLIGLITIILSIFLFKNVVQKQRREIGILRAFGIYKQEIINGYSKAFAIAIMITAILAMLFGMLAYYGLNNLFKEFFNFVTYPVNPVAVFWLFLIILIEALFLMICVRYISIKRNLSVDILNMIKNVDNKNKKVKKQKYRFKKFTTNLKINTIIRNGGKTILLVYGIIFSTFLLVFALSMVTAVKDMENNIYGDEFSYGYEAIFSPGFEADEDLFSDESIIYFPANIKDNLDQTVNVVGYDEQNPYININEDIPLNKNEIYISTALKDEYKLEIDDEVIVNNPRNIKEQYTFKVKGIADNQAEQKIYANINYIQEQLDLEDNYYNGYVGDKKTKEQINQGDNNMTYYSPQEIIKGMNQYSKLINVVIVGVSIFAFTISLIALGVVTNIIIKNNEKIISIMKVLGFSTKEINSLIITGYRPIVIVSFLIAFPLSSVGVKYYLKFITSLIDGLNYPLVLKPTLTIFIVSFVIILLSFEVTLFLTKKKIDKVSLSKSLNIDE